MTILEYNKKVKTLEVEFKKAKDNLIIDYVDSNNSYVKGDIITDHIGSIELIKVKYSAYKSVPEAVYYGLELKKDKTPRKRTSYRVVYESNIIE